MVAWAKGGKPRLDEIPTFERVFFQLEQGLGCKDTGIKANGDETRGPRPRRCRRIDPERIREMLQRIGAEMQTVELT